MKYLLMLEIFWEYIDWNSMDKAKKWVNMNASGLLIFQLKFLTEDNRFYVKFF